MLEPALTRALVPHGRRRPLDRLTGAEREVLRLVSTGASNTAAARALCCNEATIRKHLEHTYRKLGVANRTAAAALLHEPSGV
jgi:DNA-binding NarL/FixJ family response regulator